MIDDLRHQGLRKRMIDYLHVQRGIDSQRVLKAMNIVPRHLFLDSSFGNLPMRIRLSDWK